MITFIYHFTLSEDALFN